MFYETCTRDKKNKRLFLKWTYSKLHFYVILDKKKLLKYADDEKKKQISTI